MSGKLQGLTIDLGLNTMGIDEGLRGLQRKLKVVNSEMEANLSAFGKSEKSIERLGATYSGLTKKLEVQGKILEQSKKNYQQLVDSQEELTRALKSAEDNVQKSKKAYEDLSKVQGVSKKELREAAKEVKESEKAYQKLNKELIDLPKSIDNAANEVNKQTKFYNRLQDSVDGSRKSLERFKAEQKTLSTGWGKASQSLDDYSKKMDNISNKLAPIGQNMTMGLTVPIALGFGAAIKKGMEFEASMSEVKALTKATGSDFKELKDYAVELGEKTAFSAKESADGMAVLGQAGFKTNQIIEAMPGLLDLAAASKMNLADSADIVVSSLNSFQLDAKKAGHATDVLTKAGAETNASLSDMGEAMKYVGPVAGSLGYTLEDTAGAIGLLSDYGIKGSQAGTSLRMGLMRLNSPGEKLGKEMKKMGINVHDSSGKMKSMAGILAELQDSTKEMSKEERAALITRIVGTEASTAWISLMQKSPKHVDKFSESLKNSNGYAKDFAKTMRDNLSGDWDNFTGGLETFAGKVYDDFAPALRSIVKGADGLVGAISAAPKPLRMAAVGLGLGAAATGPLIVGFGMVARAASDASKGVSALTGRLAKNAAAAEVSSVANATAGASIGKSGKGIEKTGGLLSMFGKNAGNAGKSAGLLSRSTGLLVRGIGLLSNPIGATVAVVATLAAGFKLAYDHIGWFHKGVDNTGKLLKEVMPNMNFKWLGNLGKDFKKAGDGIGWVAKKAFELSPVGQVTKRTFDVVNKAVSKTTDKTKVFGKDVSNSTEKALKSYTRLSEQATLKLEVLNLGHKKFNKSAIKGVEDAYKKMADVAVSQINKRRNRELTGLRKLFIDTKGLSNKEEQKILIKAQSGNAAEVRAVRSIQKQIKEITSRALKEKRNLTNVEEKKIASLQEKMDSKVVKSLSKSEKEQRLILSRMKENKKKLSVEAASEIIKQSARERDKTIDNAKKQRKKIIDEALYQRDVTGRLSKKQAQKVIDEAERQYKGSKKNAEKQHKKVVDEAEDQRKGVTKHIDKQTGRVKSKWEESWEATKKWSGKQTTHSIAKALEMYTGVKKWTGKMVSKTIDGMIDMRDGFKKWFGKIGDTFDSWKENLTTKASKLGKSVAKGAVAGLNLMIGGINKISSAIMDKNLLKPISVKGFHTGTAYGRQSDLVKNGAIARPTLAIVGDKGPGNGKGGFTREVIHRANGDMELTPATDTLVHLNKGDKIYNGRQTQQLMNQGLIPRFSTGSGGNSFFQESKKMIADTGKSLWGGVKNAGKMIGDIAGDIWDYIENPKKLVDMVIGNIGGNFGDVGGLTGDLAGAAFSSMKKSLVSKVKSWFEEFGGGDGDGGYIKYLDNITTPYSPNGPPKGYAFNWAHPAIDLPYIYEPVHSTISGIARGKEMPGGFGHYIEVIGGALKVIYGHLSKWSIKQGQHVKPGTKLGISGNTGASTGPHLHYEMHENGKPINPVTWLKSHNGRGKGSGNWTTQIRQAASRMGAHVNNGDINDILSLINTESSGNQTVVQHGYTDVNTGGNEARGLLQYTPGTFASYATPGHKSILKGFDQLLAFFNNSNWRGDLSAWRRRMASGSTGWGPTGHRKFANGGMITEHQMYEGGEEGHEMVVPLTLSRRSRAIQLIEQAMKIVGMKQDSGGVTINSDTSTVELLLTKLVAAEERNAALTRELIEVVRSKPTGVTKGEIYRANKEVQNEQSRLNNMIQGKGAYA